MDVRIEGDREADGWLRFASYHTAISAPMHDSVHGISAKGLTGERYNQFVWWDAEIHQLPFFIHTAPQTAKQQLLYRYRCLPQAKENARKEGYDGAKFAFCSSVNFLVIFGRTDNHSFGTLARIPFAESSKTLTLSGNFIANSLIFLIHFFSAE